MSRSTNFIYRFCIGVQLVKIPLGVFGSVATIRMDQFLSPILQKALDGSNIGYVQIIFVEPTLVLQGSS